MTQPVELIYIADPMCSWCWVAPALDALREEFAAPITWRLLLGGLRPGVHAVPLDAAFASELRHHWEQVHEATGQPFTFDLLDAPGDFLYDTEPASRALVAIRRKHPGREFPFLHRLHKAFYVENLDITEPSVLTELAGADLHGVPDPLPALDSPQLAEETQLDFEAVRRLGVTGFPTLALTHGGLTRPILFGCTPLLKARETLRQALNFS